MLCRLFALEENMLLLCFSICGIYEMGQEQAEIVYAKYLKALELRVLAPSCLTNQHRLYHHLDLDRYLNHDHCLGLIRACK